MNTALARLRALDPRVRIGAAAIAVLLVVGGILAVALNVSPTPVAVASPTPTVEPPATPARARSTPAGTPPPRPPACVGPFDSIHVNLPPAPRSTPTPD